METLEFLRLPDVTKKIGLGKSALYERMSAGIFPPSIKLGYNVVVWPAHEVNQIMCSYVSGESDEQRKALVSAQIKLRVTNQGNQPTHASSLSVA